MLFDKQMYFRQHYLMQLSSRVSYRKGSDLANKLESKTPKIFKTKMISSQIYNDVILFSNGLSIRA